MTDPTRSPTPDNVHDVPAMSPREFALWGIGEVAYVRPENLGDATAFAIVAANGDTLGHAPSRDLAMAAAVQHDLHPVGLH